MLEKGCRRKNTLSSNDTTISRFKIIKTFSNSELQFCVCLLVLRASTALTLCTAIIVTNAFNFDCPVTIYIIMRIMNTVKIAAMNTNTSTRLCDPKSVNKNNWHFDLSSIYFLYPLTSLPKMVKQEMPASIQQSQLIVLVTGCWSSFVFQDQ